MSSASGQALTAQCFAASPLSVLCTLAFDKQQYGEVAEDAAFAEPVVVTAVSVLPDASAAAEQRPVVFKAWARDLDTPAAARFASLIGAVHAPCEAAPVAQVFATQHVVLRGRCSKATLQLLGYPLSSAPEHLKAAAEARLCQLPEVMQQLSPPTLQQRKQQQQDQLANAAAPSLPRLAGQVLPLRKVPPAFVLTLAPLAKFWEASPRTVPLPAGAVANSDDLQACEQMAAAVLAAKRGNPCALMAKLSTTLNPYNLAVDWDGIRDSVLDMATYCCSALATNRVNMPDSMELAMAGVCAAILLAACQDTAAQLLTWPGRPRPAAIVITELVSVPHPPQRLQDYGTGLIDILMESCPTLACSALQGTLNPCKSAPPAAGPGSSGPVQQSPAPPAAAAATALGGKPWRQQSGASGGAASGSGANHLDGTPPKRQRLGHGPAGDGAGVGSADRRASFASAGAAAPAVSGSGSGVHGLASGGRRQSGGLVASASVAGDGLGGSQGTTAAGVTKDSGGDAGQAGDEDDGGLYEGLQGEGEGADRGDGTGSRSASPERERPGQAEEGGEGSDQHNGAGQEGDAAGGEEDGEEEDAGYEGEQGYERGASEDVEQLDFEDTEYTGMHGDGDDLDGAVEQQQEEPSKEGVVQEGWNGYDEHAGGSSGQGQQQQHSGQDGGDGQRQQNGVDDERQQHEDEEEPEDGEYRTDEADYEELEDQPTQATEASAPKAEEQPAGKQPPLPQLYHGQLYNAVLKLALSPLHQDAAISAASVLRRLRAYHCLDVLQGTVGPMLAGKVNALLLSPPELCAQVKRVAAAASDLATLVLHPPPSKQSPALKAPQAGSGSSLPQLQPQRQDADACVLQLMLGFRVLDLLAAFVIYIGVHVCRLVQLQQQLLADLPSAEQQQQQVEMAEQQAQLCAEQAQLLDAVRALTSALSASSGGWSFLTAARDGLAALATAVCPTRQVCLDGGPFSPDSSAPYDTHRGWQAERQALLAAAAGLGGTPTDAGALLLCGAGDDAASATAAGDLSDSLQRLWLLVEATAQVQASKDLLSAGYSSFSIRDGRGSVDRLNMALLTLFKAGFASEVGQQSLVSALAASVPALRQLVALLEQCGKVQVAAAAAGQHKQQEGQGLLDDSLGVDDDLFVSPAERPSLVYGALYAPDLLLAVMSSPHVDALTAWLPLATHAAAALKALLAEQERCSADAARAAFPDLRPTADSEEGQQQHRQRRGGPLRTAVIPGGWDAARQQREQLLCQLHGFVMTGERLARFWQLDGDGSGSGSGAELLDWLSQQLPPLVSVPDERSLRLAEDAAGAGPPGHSRSKAPEPVVRAAAAAAVANLDGVAATTGVPPPWGQDVRSDAVVEFMRNAACRSAALCSLHLIDMLLRGAPQGVRILARRAADRPRERIVTPYALNPSMTLNPDGTLGPQGPTGFVGVPQQQGVDAALLRDGFGSRELVCELLKAGLLDVLERALRTATVAMRASDTDLVWSIQGGSQQDMLSVLQARTAAAALMRAACSTTASLLVNLADADTKPLEACSLLDALVYAHSAVVTSREGLQACVPHPQLAPFITRATDPALDPMQLAAADAAVSSAAARVSGSRVLMLLEARQALAVCLRCWQLQGWWPDPVGALLGAYPHASDAAEGFAKEAAAARKAGDPSAPPPHAPRQGPRQLLSSLLGLADLCPEEWPPRGASQAAARARDAAADGQLEGSPFERPSQMRLRGQLAMSLEAHWDRLEGLINFGLSCSTRLARLALVRMLARMCGVGGGTSPQLGPAVFGVLRRRLEEFVKSRNQLAANVGQIKASTVPPGEKQRQINNAVKALVLQLWGAIQVCEVLLPLCGAPSIKSVLTEHKAVGVVGKAVYALVRPQPDLQQLVADDAAAARAGPAPSAGPGVQRLATDAQVLAGLLLQLFGVLMDPDISMNPWADSFTRELHDTPAVYPGRAAISWLLSACDSLNPANMALLSQLLVGPSMAGGRRCLYDYPKGRFLLRLSARCWHMLATQVPAAGAGLTQAELQMSAEWAAAALESMQCASGPDASHAASCAAIAQVFRQLAGVSIQEGEQIGEAERTRPAAGSIPRFVTAVKTAIAAHRPGGQDSQSITTLLSSAPLLLACDAACLDFWTASAASAEYLQGQPAPPTYRDHTAAAVLPSAQQSWPQAQLVGLPSARVLSRSITEVMGPAGQQQGGAKVPPAAASPAAGAGGGGGSLAGAVSEIPAIRARRGHQPFGKDSRGNISMHVDDFEHRQRKRTHMAHMAPPVGQVPPGAPSAGMMHSMGPMAMGAAAAAAGLAPMAPMVPGMVGPMGPGPGGMMGPGPMGQMMAPDPSIGTQLLMQHQMMQQQMMMGGGMPPQQHMQQQWHQ